MSAATAAELTAVLMRYGDVAIHGFAERTLADWGVEIVPFDAQQSRVAQQAYRDYGRGSGHPARLNMGDCYSYALAAVLREPLLYVGDDFVHTDIPSADAPGDRQGALIEDGADRATDGNGPAARCATRPSADRPCRAMPCGGAAPPAGVRRRRDPRRRGRCPTPARRPWA
jgi:ribonuclease VapC